MLVSMHRLCEDFWPCTVWPTAGGFLDGPSLKGQEEVLHRTIREKVQYYVSWMKVANQMEQQRADRCSPAARHELAGTGHIPTPAPLIP